MLAINPGSTTTEIGYFSNEREIFRQQINHSQDVQELAFIAQHQARYDELQSVLDNIDRLDAIAARGGPLKPLTGGVYQINDLMLSAYKSGKYSNHASNFGALIAEKLTKQFKVPAYVVDPVTTDEFIDVARISGVPGIERKSRSHALNIKHCAKKAAAELGIKLIDSKFIIAHLGSGFSIAAVQAGKIIDVNDALLGMGPFSIERAGSLPISGILEKIYYKAKTRPDIEKLFSSESGLQGYLGTNNFPDIEQRINNGDKKAKLIVDAMIYQIVKEIGGIHATFAGKTSALIFTGGLANSKYLIAKINNYLNFIKPQIVYPGSFELEALAEGVLRVLQNKDNPKVYS